MTDYSSHLSRLWYLIYITFFFIVFLYILVLLHLLQIYTHSNSSYGKKKKSTQWTWTGLLWISPCIFFFCSKITPVLKVSSFLHHLLVLLLSLSFLLFLTSGMPSFLICVKLYHHLSSKLNWSHSLWITRSLAAFHPWLHSMSFHLGSALSSILLVSVIFLFYLYFFVHCILIKITILLRISQAIEKYIAGFTTLLSKIWQILLFSVASVIIKCSLG